MEDYKDLLEAVVQNLAGGGTTGEVSNASFENNGIDKSHDGAKYDAVTTEDGKWIIYKDIDTKTRKVNVYVESKYYKPTFQQFVFEKACLVTFLDAYALPIYSFSDLSDYAATMGMANAHYQGIEGITEDEYMKKRREEMGVGPFFEELLEQMGLDAYDAYTEMGKLALSLQKGQESEPDINKQTVSVLDDLIGGYSEIRICWSYGSFI